MSGCTAPTFQGHYVLEVGVKVYGLGPETEMQCRLNAGHKLYYNPKP